MVHVAVVGTGRVGQGLAYTLLFERYVDELSLADIKPNVAAMVKEELYHASVWHGIDIKINAYEHSRFVENADLIIIPAGFPRKPGMTRRDLADENAKVIYDIITATVDKNPNAWYFIITNPVDAMATLAKHLAGKNRIVVGTGTNLETVRFRTILARKLNVPIRLIEGFVGGEHGQAAVLLWSAVRVDGQPLDDYLTEHNIALDKEEIKQYVKGISMEVIKALGGTRWGPAGGFIEIIRGLLLNTDRLLSYAVPRKIGDLEEPVFVTVPARISRSLGPDIWKALTKEEQEQIIDAAKAIHQTYIRAKSIVSK